MWVWLLCSLLKIIKAFSHCSHGWLNLFTERTDRTVLPISSHKCNIHVKWRMVSHLSLSLFFTVFLSLVFFPIVYPSLCFYPNIVKIPNLLQWWAAISSNPHTVFACLLQFFTRDSIFYMCLASGCRISDHYHLQIYGQLRSVGVTKDIAPCLKFCVVRTLS